jgi:flagellar biosynthesis protein FlhF
MKIRKITAATMPEAMNRVKKELGSDAVILYTKNLHKKSLFGFINKKYVEVVAALDQKAPAENNNQYIPPVSPPPAPIKVPVQTHMPTQRVVEPQPMKPVQPQIKSEPVVRTPVSKEWSASQPNPIKLICEKLLEEGIGTKHIDTIGQALLKYWYSEDKLPTETAILKQLKNVLLEKLSNEDFSGINYKNRILILVGPTGVGKTTTAAKLASKALLDDGKSVAFITTDTYRIAAVDQLKTYAKILNVPVEVAYSMEDFDNALLKHKDKDLIIVDSAGRNYQQSKFVRELRALIPFGQGMETHLVVAATAKPADLSYIVGQFRDIPIQKFILTKVDETRSLGSLLHLILEHHIGVSYFTNGQNVPDDMIEADREAFVRQLIEGVFRG